MCRYELRFDQSELVERIKAQMQEAYLGPSVASRENSSSGNDAHHVQYLMGEVDKLKKVMTHLIQQDNSTGGNQKSVKTTSSEAPNSVVLSPHTPDAPRRRGRPPGSGSRKSLL